MRTILSTFKSAMKAPQYQNLSSQQLKIYESGFRNGFKLANSEFDKKTKELKTIIKQLKKPTIDINKINLKKYATPNDMQKVIKWISKIFEVDQNTILNKSRYVDNIKLRSLAINIIYENFDVSTPALGRFFSMDHTSILHHINNRINFKSCWKVNSILWKYYNEFTL